MKRIAAVLITLIFIFAGCIKLDFFLFDGDQGKSISDTYHGLPLYSGTESPEWIKNAQVEREIYLSVDGEIIETGDIGTHEEYIHGCFLPAPVNAPADSCPLTGKNVTFLYTHGNSGDLFKYWYRAVSLWSLGANVFIFTYRGYGLSEGEATRAGIKQDADAAAAYVKSRADVDTSRIIVYGYSMGAVVASYLTGKSCHRNSVAGTVLESGLDSPEETVRLSTGIDFPGSFFLDKESFNGPEFIKDATCPVLHIHGKKDVRVTPDQALNYYRVLKDKPRYTHYIGLTSAAPEQWIALADHRNVPFTAFSAEFHIADYWDDPQNDHHCCINPFEFEEAQFQDFLDKTGGTDGDEMSRTADAYRGLISGWILDNFNW
ncbi:MAG: alpha/beta hydrolase [Fibrobacter sp.]|nr:alpha/beta hydrolase [Fibrobacter sp.]